MPEDERRQQLIRELKLIRKTGLHRLREYLDELPALRELARVTRGGGTGDEVEYLLRHVYTQRSEGAQGTAVGILLGLELGRRGAKPSVLRELAARRLGYQSVDTFRKRPEANAIATFADLLDSYARDVQNQPEPEGANLERIMTLIEQLTMAEYGELVRRLRRRMASLADDPEAQNPYWQKEGKPPGVNR